jgi:hypothetical protein
VPSQKGLKYFFTSKNIHLLGLSLLSSKDVVHAVKLQQINGDLAFGVMHVAKLLARLPALRKSLSRMSARQ